MGHSNSYCILLSTGPGFAASEPAAHHRSGCPGGNHHCDHDSAELELWHMRGGARVAGEWLWDYLPLPRRCAIYSRYCRLTMLCVGCELSHFFSNVASCSYNSARHAAVTRVPRAIDPAGSFNDLATAYMAFPDRTISHLFSLGSLTPQVIIHCTGVRLAKSQPQCACIPAATDADHRWSFVSMSGVHAGIARQALYLLSDWH